MASFPVPVNNNLNQNNTQTPIAGVGAEGSLGGVRVDGSTIDVDPNTGVISIAGGGGGNIAGSGTAGFLPEFTAAHTIADSPLDDGVTLAGTIASSKPVAVYPVHAPAQVLLDVEAFNMVDGGPLDGIYVTDNPAGSALTDSTLLNLDPGGVGSGTNIALQITSGMAAGANNWAIKSASLCKSSFAGEVAMTDLLLTPGAAPGTLTDGQVWYDSTTHQLKARVNGTTLVIAPGMEQIAKVVLGAPAASISFSSIPAGYSSLWLQMIVASATNAAQDAVNIQFNGDSAAHYDQAQVYTLSAGAATGSGVNAETSIGLICPGATVVSGAGEINMQLSNYAGTAFFKSGTTREGGPTSAGYAISATARGWQWRSTAAINAILAFLNSGANFVTGCTAVLWGLP